MKQDLRGMMNNIIAYTHKDWRGVCRVSLDDLEKNIKTVLKAVKSGDMKVVDEFIDHYNISIEDGAE